MQTWAVLYSKNSEQKLPMAKYSQKIGDLYLHWEDGRMDDLLQYFAYAASQPKVIWVQKQENSFTCKTFVCAD